MPTDNTIIIRILMVLKLINLPIAVPAWSVILTVTLFGSDLLKWSIAVDDRKSLLIMYDDLSKDTVTATKVKCYTLQIQN